jgi:hypothetical protein
MAVAAIAINSVIYRARPELGALAEIFTHKVFQDSSNRQ